MSEARYSGSNPPMTSSTVRKRQTASSTPTGHLRRHVSGSACSTAIGNVTPGRRSCPVSGIIAPTLQAASASASARSWACGDIPAAQAASLFTRQS